MRFFFLKEDSYWDVALKDRYDFSKAPEKFEHGQLYDDWEFLSCLLENEDEAVVLMLCHLAPLLRYIGEHDGVECMSKES